MKVPTRIGVPARSRIVTIGTARHVCRWFDDRLTGLITATRLCMTTVHGVGEGAEVTSSAGPP